MTHFPSIAINFAIKDAMREVNPYDRSSPIGFFIGNLVVGGVAGAVGMLFTYPLSLARLRLAMDVGIGQNREFHGSLLCL
jgi:solute carrier family 25 (adenine nucleotide translocator) protein 4/5/6/31